MALTDEDIMRFWTHKLPNRTARHAILSATQQATSSECTTPD